MFEPVAQFAELIFEFLRVQLTIVLTYPFAANQRIFWLYLVTSGILAFYVFYANAKSNPAESLSLRAFVGFLLPKNIWKTTSAWLDIRYFFFHQIFRLVINVTFLTYVLSVFFQIIAGDAEPADVGGTTFDVHILDIALATAYMFVLIAFVDFVSYATHYAQHKVGILWEFHKVHHSLEVMHPLSNYREHPIDNITYSMTTGATYGAVMGLASNLFGYLPSMPQFLGIPVLMFVFNIMGYNLRHSHVWLRWPGRWSMLFASPAHHHIHHSCHPDHIDKNFAFMFPFWDVLFRTYILPETNKNVCFGLSPHYVNEYKSCLGIYFIPIRNALVKIFK